MYFQKNTNNIIRTTLPNKPLRIKNSIFILVGSKNSAALTHFIQDPRPMPRRKKHPRMNKESPSCQETSPRTILSSANQNCKKEERHALKDNLPKRPKQKVLTQWTSYGSMVEEQFQEKVVTSALNAHSWWSGRINEEMTSEQYHLGCCHSQKTGEGGRWDKHSSSNLHDQQMEGQDQWKWGI